MNRDRNRFQFDEQILKIGAGLNSNSSGVSDRDLRAKILTLQSELAQREREAGACTCVNKKRKSTAPAFLEPAESALHAPTSTHRHVFSMGRKGDEMEQDSLASEFEPDHSARGTHATSNAKLQIAATNSVFSAHAGTNAANVNFSSKVPTTSTFSSAVSAGKKRTSSASNASASNAPAPSTAMPSATSTAAIVKSGADRNLREWS